MIEKEKGMVLNIDSILRLICPDRLDRRGSYRVLHIPVLEAKIKAKQRNKIIPWLSGSETLMS